MLYQRHSFQVPASAKSTFDCEQVGHAMRDAKGNCIRCGNPVEPKLWNGTSPVADAPTESRYVELLGGPLDGQIVRADQIDEHGTVTVDGVAYGRYPAGADEYKGMERREHAVDWQHRALLQNVPDSAIIEGAGIERAL